jgi:hypothetical protein
LKAAIEGQAKIIITTIQKFSTEHLRVISGQGTRRFADPAAWRPVGWRPRGEFDFDD